MEFKISRTVTQYAESGEWYSLDSYDIINGNKCALEKFISSSFMYWVGTRQNEALAEMNKVESQFKDWKFHGFYDAKLLKLNHFQRMDMDEFIDRFVEYMNRTLCNDLFRKKFYFEIKNTFESNDNQFFLIKDLGEKFYHPNTVFDIFLSGIVFKNEHDSIHLIQIGFD